MISSCATRGRRIVAAGALLSLLAAWSEPLRGQSNPGYSWSWANPVSGDFSAADDWITSDPEYQTIPYSNRTSTVAPPPGDALNFINGTTNYTVTMSGASSSQVVTFENGSTPNEVWNVTLLFSQNFQASQLFGPATNEVIFSGDGVLSAASLFPGGSSLVISGLEFDAGNIPQAAPILPGNPMQEVLVTNGGKFVTLSNVNLYGITVQGGEWDHNAPGNAFGVSDVSSAIPQITIDNGRVVADEIFFDLPSGGTNPVPTSHITSARNHSVLNIGEYGDGIVQLESGSTLHDTDTEVDAPLGGPGPVINSAQWTVDDLFAVNSGSVLVTNGGSISAGRFEFTTNGYGALTVAGGGSSASCTGSLQGIYVAKASNGGVISFGSATLTPGASLTSDGAGSFVECAGTISGTGELSADNGGALTVNNISLTNGSVYESSSNTTLTMGGTLDLSGGSLTAMEAASANIATANLANASLSLDGAGSLAQIDTLDLGSGQGSVLATVTDNAMLRNTSSGVLDIGQVGGSIARLIIASQASLNIPGNCYVGDAGMGTLWVHGGGQALIGGSLLATFEIGAQATGNGAVTVSDPASSLKIGAPLAIGVSNTGSFFLTNAASVRSDVVGLAAFPGSSGTLLVSDPGSVWVADNNILVGGTPSAEPGGTGTLVVSNGGALRAGPLLYISASGLANVAGGGEVAVGTGAFGAPGTLTVTQGGKLFGKGTVQGQLIIAQGGVFDPGGSPGIFNIQGNYQQEAGGVLDIVVDGSSAGTGFSQLNISGSAILGGTVNVIVVNGFKPSAGQNFQILVATNVSGTFAQVNGAAVSYAAGGVTLSNVTGVSAPAALSIQWLGQTLAVTWPDAAQAYSLQTTSDLSTWTNVSTFANTFVIDTNAVPSAFFRLIHN